MTIEFGNLDENALTKDHAVAQLIKAIALEEEALSKLMNIEADKTFAFVGRNLDFPTGPSTSDIIKFNHTVIQFLDTMLMTEWLLLKKLDSLSHLQDSGLLHEDDNQFSHNDVLDY